MGKAGRQCLKRRGRYYLPTDSSYGQQATRPQSAPVSLAPPLAGPALPNQRYHCYGKSQTYERHLNVRPQDVRQESHQSSDPHSKSKSARNHPLHTEIAMSKHSQPGFHVPLYITVPILVVLVAALPAILVYSIGKEKVANGKKKRAMKKERKRAAQKAAKNEEILNAGECKSVL